MQMPVVPLPPDLSQPDAQLDQLRDTARSIWSGPEGARIHWAEWGPRDAPVMVMLHGAYGSWPHFVRNINAFSHDHRVLIPDIPGYGRSDTPPAPVRLVDIAAQLARALDEVIGPDTPYRLVGFSFGGGLSGPLLLEHPGRQTHVLLGAPAGIAPPATPAMVSVRNRTGDDLIAAQRANLQSIMLKRPESVTPLALRIQHECTAMARLRVERVDWGPGLIVSVPGYKGNLTCVWGDSDSFVDPAELPDRPARIRAMNPAADTHILPETGHWMQFESAESFNAILRDLVSKPPV